MIAAPDFDTFVFDALTTLLPSYTVVPDVDNTALWDDGADPMEGFPLVVFSVSASESDPMRQVWDGTAPGAWSVTMHLTALADPADLGGVVSTVYGAVRSLRYARYDLEGTSESIVVQEVRATQLFSNTGRVALVGGKSIAQKSGQFTMEIRETTG